MTSNLFRRVGAFVGHTGLLAALALVATALLAGAPRLATDSADRALRADVGRLPHLVRDVILTSQPGVSRSSPPQSAAGVDQLAGLREALPQPLSRLVGTEWYAAAIGPTGVQATGDKGPFRDGPPDVLGLRAQTGVTEAARLVAGAWPRSTRAAPVQIVMSRAAVGTLGLDVGDAVDIRLAGGGAPVTLTLVGIFEPLDPTAPVWDDLRLALEPLKPINDGDPYESVAVTDWAGLDQAAARLGAISYSWRFRIAEQRLDTSLVEPVIRAVGAARRDSVAEHAPTTSLDSVLARLDGQLRAADALLAVVRAGLAAGLLGLILLAAQLTVHRRRTELALLRARGAALRTIAARLVAEAAPVQPVAVLAGWLLATALPGRPANTEWLLVVALAVTATAAVPVLAVLGQRRAGFTRSRQNLVRQRTSARRLTVEICVLVLAVLGLLLLRRRGLSQDGGVDPYLVSVPVLLATGAALVALRVTPWPLRVLLRLARRATGAVLFLGLARTGRGAPATAGPLAVLVVAIATAVFSGVVATSVDAARDRATDQAVGGDALLTGHGFAPDTGRRLAELPGVRAVAPLSVEANRSLLSGSGSGSTARLLGQAQVLVLDMPAFARVARDSGMSVTLPDALSTARPDTGPVPALVSPEIADLVGADAVVDVQGLRFGFAPAVVATEFPGLTPGSRRFVVLPWQALPVPDYRPIVPNRYLLAGDGFDTAELRRVADAGQRQQLESVLGSPVDEPSLPATVTSWQEYRRGLDRTGANEVLTVTFTVGALGGAALTLLAVGFAVVAEARARAQVVSRLRTLGLSPGQRRRLLVSELVPLVAVAALTGGLVGAALPRLLAPALGLSHFAVGAVALYLDPRVLGGLLALVLVGLVGALVVEDLVTRRMRLGEVLRFGEEN